MRKIDYLLEQAARKYVLAMNIKEQYGTDHYLYTEYYDEFLTMMEAALDHGTMDKAA